MTDIATIATITEGREALRRVRERSKAMFEDWFLIGAALKAGQTECLRLAGSNSLQSPAYRKHIRQWLDSNGFADLDGHERTSAMWMSEHQAEVIAWRMRLDDAARRNANHPNVIFAHMKAGTLPQRRGPKSRQLVHTIERRAEPVRTAIIERPEQDLIRYVADAMRQSRKQDWLGLAVVSIEAQRRYESLAPARMPARAPAQLELQA